MMFAGTLISIFITSLDSFVQAQNASTAEIIPLLRQANLVPQIVPSFNATIGPFVITYPQAIVNYGNNLNLSLVSSSPLVQFGREEAFDDSKYTLAMIDPDAPTPQNPTAAQIRHWFVSDIEPSTNAQNLTNTGTVLSSYRSPAPPMGSAPHRYSFFLLRQPAGITVSLYNQTGIAMFDLSLAIRQNNLTLVSGNYFVAQYSNTTSSTNSSSTANQSGMTTSATNLAPRNDFSVLAILLSTIVVVSFF